MNVIHTIYNYFSRNMMHYHHCIATLWFDVQNSNSQKIKQQEHRLSTYVRGDIGERITKQHQKIYRKAFNITHE